MALAGRSGDGVVEIWFNQVSLTETRVFPFILSHERIFLQE